MRVYLRPAFAFCAVALLSPRGDRLLADDRAVVFRISTELSHVVSSIDQRWVKSIRPLITEGRQADESALRARLGRTFRAEAVGAAESRALFAALRRLDRFVSWVEADMAGTVAGGLPGDPFFSLQWSLSNVGQSVGGSPGLPGADINILDAWREYETGGYPVVAVVDTGVDQHVEFGERLLEGEATVGDPYDSRDACGHGTRVAGIVAAGSRNRIGIAGINDSVRILPIRVFDSCTGGAFAAAAGVVRAVDLHADVIVIALAFSGDSSALRDAVAYAAEQNVLVIGAAGNSASDEPTYPAAYSGCLGVSATDHADTLATFSAFGDHVTMAAPGVSIYSTVGPAGYAADSGTSAAAAHVAGVASLLVSFSPQSSSAALRGLLTAGAEDLGDAGTDPYFGEGRLDAFGSLSLSVPPPFRFVVDRELVGWIPPDGTGVVEVAVVDGSETVDRASVELAFRSSGGEFEVVSMQHTGGGRFRGSWPAFGCGEQVDYYFRARGNGGSLVTHPEGAPQLLHEARAVFRRLVFEDDFEWDQGWVSGGDDSPGTTGHWVLVEPVGTSAQPEFDRSPDQGDHCYITGQHTGGNDGTADVDGGPVELISPVIAIAPDAFDVEVFYSRWFASTGGNPDLLEARLSSDGGETWPILVEAFDETSGWQSAVHRLSDSGFPVGEPIRLKFSVADIPNDSLTEAAVDEVAIYQELCSFFMGDVDGDGSFDLADFAELPGCWTGPGADARAAVCRAFDSDFDDDVDLFDLWRFGVVFQGEVR